ncbi:MAG: phosphate transport system regulatory protein PhoU [Acidobacteria bacterium]|jgi:phosphate transport system protein|nr:MAG: phosphate transport system regulatory protein PhoU [Acidobacteriota bacterium]GIU82643.1 MAG: phosphate transport system regulatory protein PhoU [Pyrinomonadaceae bacterium]
MHQRIIDKYLEELEAKLLRMGSEVERLLKKAIESLIETNEDLAREAIEMDRTIDAMELEIDRFCIEVLALHQPAAHDLRFVISIAKITPILERIADHATSIAEATIRISQHPKIKSYFKIPIIAEKACKMLKESLEAIISEDAEAARQIIKQDKEIDADYKETFDKLLEMMIEDTSTTAVAAQLLFVAKHLERIGDYIKDICELTVYMKEAVFIKHHGESSEL